MSLGSKFNIESKGMLATLIFYAVAGIIFLVLLPLTNFPPHLGIIGIFSLIVAYGTFRKRNWTIWFVIILFFATLTFSVYMLYNYFALGDYILGTAMTAYLILTCIFTAYAVSKRRSLES
jgi:hypothetical protein